MKIAIIISILVTLIYIENKPVKSFPGSGCTTGTGHALENPDSVHHAININWKIDTIEGDLNFIECIALPEGKDTFYYNCIRCDSIVYRLSDVIRLTQRKL